MKQRNNSLFEANDDIANKVFAEYFAIFGGSGEQGPTTEIMKHMANISKLLDSFSPLSKKAFVQKYGKLFLDFVSAQTEMSAFLKGALKQAE